MRGFSSGRGVDEAGPSDDGFGWFEPGRTDPNCMTTADMEACSVRQQQRTDTVSVLLKQASI
jgi:hypothetical protein